MSRRSPADSVLDGLIAQELRQLQREPALQKMSIFDLIDHCTETFETTLQKQTLHSFIRAYLIFNYFINNFVMMHFNGFQDFLESAHNDFVLYLNLYSFFANDTLPNRGAYVVEGYAVSLAHVTARILRYLTEKGLLTFDIALLHNWLDEYIEYYRRKEGEGEEDERSPEALIKLPELDLRSPGSNFSARFDEIEFSDDELFEFNTKFPEVPEAPYPVKALAYPPADPESSTETLRNPEYGTFRNLPYSPRPPIPVPQRDIQIEQVLPLEALSADSAQSSSILPYSKSPNSQLRSHANHLNLHPNSHFQPTAHNLNSDPELGRHHPSHHHPNLANHPDNRHPNHPNNRPSSNSHLNLTYPNSSHQNGGYDRKPLPQPANLLRDFSVCGLKNLGSSCYINLTIQVLAGIGSFGKLLAGAHKAHKIVHNSLTDAMFGLISTFHANGGAVVAPTKFIRLLAAAKPDFNIPYEQQDAQEFLLFLLDNMHAELATKGPQEMVDYSKKWKINVSQREKNDYFKWYNGLLAHEGGSLINDIFQGHIQSKLLCNTCGHHSISYSSFNILSLPIPGGNDHHVDLTDCLRYYTQDEVLSGDNAWNCPKCNKTDDESPMDIVFQPKRGLFKFSKRSKSPARKAAPTKISIKQLSFIKLPPVLFIHLSRFSMLNGTDKLTTDIIYPLRLKFNHSSHDIYYSLSGVINHFGTLKSGHYTSLVNKRKVRKGDDSLKNPFWCYFDDDNVRLNVVHGDVGTPEGGLLHSRDVYVLCYERV